MTDVPRNMDFSEQAFYRQIASKASRRAIEYMDCAPEPGLEHLARHRLNPKAATATQQAWSTRKSGAGKESRTLDLNLGKVALYQLSYSRVSSPEVYNNFAGIPAVEGNFFCSRTTALCWLNA